MDTIKKYIKKEMSFESLYSSLDSNSCYHEPKDIFKIKQNISVCFGCSSIIYTNESGKKFCRLNLKNIMYLKKPPPQSFYRYAIPIAHTAFAIRKIISKFVQI